MCKKQSEFAPPISFEELTPQMQIGRKEQDDLCEKTFLSSEPGHENEFSVNTTTWD